LEETYALVTVAITVAFVAVGCGSSDWGPVTPHYTLRPLLTGQYGRRKAPRSLDDLPTSLPEVYVQYLKQVNPKTSAASNSFSDEEMLKVAKTLGKLALQPNYVPKEFSPEAARDALKSNGWASFDPIDPIERLKSNGVLFQKEIGASTRFRFALDPVAEFLGAFAHAEECGADQDLWKRILANSVSAPGFQIALRLIRQVYGGQLGWAVDQT